MGLEENHKGSLSPFPFSHCQFLGSSEAPNRVTSKVKGSGPPLACVPAWASSFPTLLLKKQHFNKQGLQIPGGSTVRCSTH